MQQGRNCGLLMFQTADVSDCFFLWLHLCSFVYCCIRLFSCSLVFLWALDLFLLELTDWNGFYGGGAQLFKSFLLLYIQGVLVGVLGSADIYSQFKLIIPPEVRSYFLLIVPWLDGLCVCARACAFGEDDTNIWNDANLSRKLKLRSVGLVAWPHERVAGGSRHY